MNDSRFEKEFHVKIFSFLLTVIFGLQLYASEIFAQNCSQLGLPGNAIARLCNQAGGDVIDLDYSPDGQLLASVLRWPKQLIVWDVETKKEAMTFYDVNGLSVKFSPDGNTFVCGNAVYNASTGERHLTLSNADGYTDYVVYSPDGETLAGAGERGLRFWAAKVTNLTGVSEPIATSETAVPNVRGLSYSPDGTELAIACGLGIWMYDPASNVEVALISPSEGGHTDAVNAIAYSPDGYTLASAGDYGDNTIFLWDAQTKTHKFTFYRPHITDSSFYYLRSLSFSPDGKMLLSTDGNSKNQVHIWDPINGEYRYSFPGHNGSAQDAVFSPDGKTVASGGDDDLILLWDFEDYPTLSFAPDFVPTLESDDELAFDIKIANGENVSGYQLKVAFDTDALEYRETEYGNYLSQGVPVQPILDGHQGTVQIAALSLGGIGRTGNGTLARMKFRLKTASGSKLTFRDVLLTDSAGGTAYAWVGDAYLINRPDSEESDCVINNPRDVNKDCVVNIQDLVIVASNFGNHGDLVADVNGDRKVDIIDLALVAGAFSDAAAAPSLSTDIHAYEILSVGRVRQWVREARAVNLTDPAFHRGVSYLEQLLRILAVTETTLLPNYPNPFNPETWIPYQLAEPTDVNISISAADGTVVRTLTLGHQPAGRYESRSRAAYWDGRNAIGEPVASGLYFYNITAGEFTATRKMLIRK